MTTRDAALLVGGPCHGRHHWIPPGIATTMKVVIEPQVATYERKRIATLTGRRDTIWSHPGTPDSGLWTAIHARGIPNVISVLLPSRGRATIDLDKLGESALYQSISSLMNRSAHWNRVEVLVAADYDDPTTKKMCDILGIFCLVTPERYGYSRLNEYFNLLTEYACGEWLLLWNDDARMLTDDWDEILRDTPDSVLVADPWVDGHSPDLCTFPIVRRHLVHKTGGTFSPWTCHCDTWWQDIGRRLGVIRPVEVRIDHQRSDLRAGMHADQTRAEALAGYRSAEFYGDTVQANLHAAVERAGRALADERFKR